ncbi:hypothetical protein FB468_2290 [Leucobacter komagatae]|uniref:Lipoprotein LprG n=1 Tax=Leucobacter komagatae TaxID=55969 RepID=A0A542Y826_9MICO|nr:hypothetical protein [Leucobacter komagatae]TQL44239.1 hypothetical protein FB468_2290 [Leucobacter komagatae]
MKISRRATLTTSILLAGGLALTGCSSPAAPADGGSSTSQEAPAKGGALTQDNFAQRIADAQFAAGSVHMSMQMGDSVEGSIEADMVIDKDPKKIQMQMTMDQAGVKGDIRLVDGKMYMNMGPLSGDKFFDMSTMPGGAGDIGAILDQVNPGSQVEGFGDALTDFVADPNGPEIDGVKTTQLTLTLDTRKMFEAQGPQEGVDIDTLVSTLGESMVYDMFIGSDDLPRRIVMPNVGGMGTGTQEYTKWGEPVKIEAPAKDQIADASALQG